MIKLLTILWLSVGITACNKKKLPAPILVEPPISTPVTFAKGADVSWLTQMEAQGIQFYNANGTAQECMALLQSQGINTIRLRVWVNPATTYNNTADVLAKALRAKALGMRIMINFHYSDTWADPGSQTKPAAWAALNLTDLKAALYNHTTSVLTTLKSNGITPEWVQVGNETNDGMLWPTGKASTNMSNFAQLFNSGYDAVKSILPTTKVILHLSNGYDAALYNWMLTGLANNNTKYDVIGLSLYPTPTNWPTLNTQCFANMSTLATQYNKEVMVVEVGMGWIYSTECKAFITDLIAKTKQVPNAKGIGVLYWEPQAYNNWQGYSLGAFNNDGKPSIAITAFNN